MTRLRRPTPGSPSESEWDALTQRIEALEQGLDGALTQIRGHRAWLEALQQQAKEHRASTEERVSDLSPKLSAVATSVRSVESELAALHSESDQWRVKLEELIRRGDEQEDLGGQRAELLSALESQVKELATSQLEAGQRLDRALLGVEQVTQQVSQIQDLTHAVQGVQAATDALTRSLDERIAGSGSIEELTALVTRFQHNDTVLRRKARVTETAQEELRTTLDALTATLHATQVAMLEQQAITGQGRLIGTSLEAMLPAALEHQSLLAVLTILDQLGEIPRLNLSTTRALARMVRAAGYWGLYHEAMRAISARTGKESDQRALQMTASDIRTFSAPLDAPESMTGDARDLAGPVLHVVGKSLPITQTGYTLRTGYTVSAQNELGIPTIVAVQPGGDAGQVEAREFVHDGVQYVGLPGEPRGGKILGEWLDHFTDELEALVRRVRPSVIHAHSDFINGAAAVRVSRRTGVPVVYETRGFWEESWLSRMLDSLELPADGRLGLERVGLPDAYVLRQQAERVVRSGADAVLTLADVMREHIRRQHSSDTAPEIIELVPNAVEVGAFDDTGRDAELARELGIAEREIVIGYVTSMVEYEGVDVLIDAFATLVSQGITARLLLVGDGPYLARLRELAEPLGEAVHFTGRVDHHDVSRYYSLIDIFVVPRRPTPVARLVTPLKPFEAMAARKAVVMSDVEALQEIADASGAVETFRAGDARHLAMVLTSLIDDPEHRQQLARRAHKWVSGERTWMLNAQTALAVYERLGSRWDVRLGTIHAVQRLREMELSAADIARVVVAAGPPAQGWWTLRDPVPITELMTEGWSTPGVGTVRLDGAIDWSDWARQDRSIASMLHSWYFVDSLFVAPEGPSDDELRFVLDLVSGWNRQRIGWDDSQAQQAMTTYDMAVSLRVPRLIRLIVEVATREGIGAHLIELVEILMADRAELRRDRAFNEANNHGFYTAAAQLHLEQYVPGLPESDVVVQQGHQRMKLLVEQQFADDGGHREHSPAYHRMLLDSFANALDQGMIVDEGLEQRVARARHAMGWMVQPNGMLVQFGDTDEQPVPARSAAMQDQATAWIVSDGQSGTPIPDELFVLPSAGYAFVRSPQPHSPGQRIDSSYLAVQAGFHSRAHKHADDLSLVWFDLGQEILVDAGRFGYGALLEPGDQLREAGFFYASPERQYVESAQAHNTVALGEKLHDRRRAPYGSGILETEVEDGIFTLAARATHVDFVHQRRVRFAPRRSLVISDSFFSPKEEESLATAWYLLDGSLELVGQTDHGPIFRMSSGHTLHISTDQAWSGLARGQEEPLRGWRSRTPGSLEPAWSFRVDTGLQTRARIVTKFTIENPEREA